MDKKSSQKKGIREKIKDSLFIGGILLIVFGPLAFLFIGTCINSCSPKNYSHFDYSSEGKYSSVIDEEQKAIEREKEKAQQGGDVYNYYYYIQE